MERTTVDGEAESDSTPNRPNLAELIDTLPLTLITCGSLSKTRCAQEMVVAENRAFLASTS